MLNITEYHRPATMDEAIALLQRKQPRTVALGGGTWLNGEGPSDIGAVVDVADLGLNRIGVVADDFGAPKALRIGAAVTHQMLVEHEQTGLKSSSALHVLGEAAQAMSGVNIRNRATLAGAICTADSASPLVGALLACDAEVVLRADKTKTVKLAGFLDYHERILSDGALITEVRLPFPGADLRGVYHRVARTPKDYPIVSVVACLALNTTHTPGLANSIRIAVGGIAPHPIRLTEMEFGMDNKRVSDSLDFELDRAMAAIAPHSDYLGGAEFRKDAARTLVRRAILDLSA